MKTGITPLPPEVMAEKENAKDLTSGCKRIRIRPSKRTQHFNTTFCNIVARNVRHTLGLPVTTCCNKLDGIGSSLKMVKFLLQHFWMLQDVARVLPAPSQLLTTRSNSVVRCYVEMLCAFAGPFNAKKLAHTTTSKYISLHLRNSLDYQHFPDLAGK